MLVQNQNTTTLLDRTRYLWNRLLKFMFGKQCWFRRILSSMISCKFIVDKQCWFSPEKFCSALPTFEVLFWCAVGWRDAENTQGKLGALNHYPKILEKRLPACDTSDELLLGMWKRCGGFGGGEGGGMGLVLDLKNDEERLWKIWNKVLMKRVLWHFPWKKCEAVELCWIICESVRIFLCLSCLLACLPACLVCLSVCLPACLSVLRHVRTLAPCMRSWCVLSVL
jgi:hypothetical protein